MCCERKNPFVSFAAWLAFTFSLVNSIAMGMRLFWWGGSYGDWWMWLAIAGGFYIWHKLK